MFVHDIHVHTKQSLCAEKNALPELYFEMCAAEGIKVIGFSNHFWDVNVPGASDWYQIQNFEHINEIQEILPAESERHGVKVLFGAECEFLGGDHVSVSYEVAKNFDYLLVPPDHFHMKGFVCPKDVTEVEDVRKLYLTRFTEAASLRLPVPYSIAHPFTNAGFDSVAYETISGITDKQFADCFARAADNGAAVELQFDHLAIMKKDPRFAPVYERMYRIAKQQGCKFTFGSDAHEPKAFEGHPALFEQAAKWGITDHDVAEFVK